jgi:hypothetical protein
MPRFYFNSRDGRDFPDHDGTTLPDIGAARRSAVVAMGEAIKDYSHSFWEHPEWEMHVVDQGGDTVCRLKFSGDLL